MKKVLGGFASFIKEYNIAGMAVAFVMGAKVGEFVASLVNDILMPAVLQPAMKATQVENIAELSTNGIMRGKFLSTTIDFLVVAFVVYLLLTFLVKRFLGDEKK